MLDMQRKELGQRRFFHDLANPGRSSFREDETGLERAYADTTMTGVYYDDKNKTMYVKGTVPTSGKDWYDDVSKIPVWGDIHDADRTKQAEEAYQKLTRLGKPIDRIVGHSLGGSVALQLQQDHDIPLSRTFGAPVFHLDPEDRGTQRGFRVDRYRHIKDPVSLLDRQANMTPFFDLNPHSFAGFSKEYDTPAPYLNTYLNNGQTTFPV